MKGGKRQGAGNKKGHLRPAITDYWTPEDVKGYFKWLKSSYKKDSTLAKFVGEQLMGKAIQPIGNPDGSPLSIVFDSSFKK